MKKIFLCVILCILSCVFMWQYHKIQCENRYNTVLTEFISPDDNYKAVMFERNINATTKKSYHLSIVKKEKNIICGIGNIYISYEPFEVKWLNANELEVSNSNRGQIFKSKKRYRNISIVYN